MTTVNAAAIGYFVSSISPNIQIANAIGPPVFIILLLYGGFYINASSLPPGSEWVRYISLIYWGFQALVLNEFTGETFSCQPDETGCRYNGNDVIQSLSFQVVHVSVSL
jgi:ABC-type multidrug transport system permease subunit